MNQWSLFKRSWSIFWKNRTLWVFGLLAALGGGAASINFRGGDTSQFANLPLGGREMLRQMFQSIDVNALIGIGVVIGLVTFLIGTFGRAALYKMINAIEENQPLSVGAGFTAAGEKFLPLLAVRVLLALPTIIVGAIAAGSFLSIFSDLTTEPSQSTNLFNFGNFGTLAGLGVMVFVLTLLFGAISISAERAVVLDDLSIFAAIARGWKYIWSKFEDYFTIGLLFILVSIAFGILFVCALAPFLLASLGAALGSIRSGVNTFAFNFNLLGPAAIAAVIIGLLFGTFFSVFEVSVWTLAYRVWHVTDTTASTSI